MIPKECKRLAEVDFPIAEVSRHAAREKSIRHGHPSTLHLWWARRPLASSRAVLMALLLPDPCDPHCPEEFKTRAKELLLAMWGGRQGWVSQVKTEAFPLLPLRRHWFGVNPGRGDGAQLQRVGEGTRRFPQGCGGSSAVTVQCALSASYLVNACSGANLDFSAASLEPRIY